MNSLPFWRHKPTGLFICKKKQAEEYPQDEIEYWDSELEFKVYQALLKIPEIETIARQVLIDVLPKTDVFPKWNWNADFQITIGGKELIIEAKGQWLKRDVANRRCLLQTFRILHDFKPDLFKRILLFGNTFWVIPNSSIAVYDIKQIRTQVINLAERMT